MLGRVSDAGVGSEPRVRSRAGVRRAEGAPSSPGSVSYTTPEGLDSAARLCETGAIGTKRERKLR
nr:MAG TPA: hypothetical protein [Caudoviricetes sp.]